MHVRLFILNLMLNPDRVLSVEIKEDIKERIGNQYLIWKYWDIKLVVFKDDQL